MNRKAFTLIELLVVVAIISILAAVGVNTFTGFQEKAKIAAAKAYHSNITKGLVLENQSCEFSSTGHSTTGYVACNIQGVSLAKSLASSSLGITIGIGELNLLGENWLQYTPASGISTNVINARNKPIGRTYIYELPGYCFGIITTLGDDKDVIQNTFCR